MSHRNNEPLDKASENAYIYIYIHALLEQHVCLWFIQYMAAQLVKLVTIAYVKSNYLHCAFGKRENCQNKLTRWILGRDGNDFKSIETKSMLRISS